MKLNRILAAGFLGVALFAASTADACTNFLFTKGATRDGSTMITYAADSHTLYGELYYRKAAIKKMYYQLKKLLKNFCNFKHII